MCDEKSIISLLLKLDINELRPFISYERGPTYHEVLGISEEECPNLTDILESLARKGVLKKGKSWNYTFLPQVWLSQNYGEVPMSCVRLY